VLRATKIKIKKNTNCSIFVNIKEPKKIKDEFAKVNSKIQLYFLKNQGKINVFQCKINVFIKM